MKKISLILKKSPVSTILAILSLLSFILVYWFVTTTAIEPYYLKGLIFIIPTIIYILITYITLINKMKTITSNIISFFLSFLLISISFIAFMYLSVDAAFADTTNPNKYERILAITNYPKDKLTKHFPSQIPSNAKNVTLYYTPGFGKESFHLKFETDSSTLNNYINQISIDAIWEGKYDEAINQDFAIYNHSFNHLYNNDLPTDLKIYVLYSINENHGELSLFAYSIETNEVIFIANNW